MAKWHGDILRVEKYQLRQAALSEKPLEVHPVCYNGIVHGDGSATGRLCRMDTIIAYRYIVRIGNDALRNSVSYGTGTLFDHYDRWAVDDDSG